jgi:hypothetical protein
MAYAQNEIIEASDFNNLVGGNPTTTVNTLNATWAVGGGTAGYGQTPVANVAVNSLVNAASQWNTLVSNITNIASHQGTSIIGTTAPSAGNVITLLSSVPTNLQTVYNNRLNASLQGTTVSNTITYTSTWTSQVTFTHTLVFANGDAARYFFNSGGQVRMSVAHPAGTGIDLLFTNLASNVGNVFISAPTTGSVQLVGTSYNGVTKIGGGGNSPTIDSTRGYYGLTNSNTTIFTQTASTGPIEYQDSFIRFIARTNGTQGPNNDAGSVITIHTIWDQVPNGLVVSTGSETTMTAIAPETTFISNTWGAFTVSGTVSGT